MSAPDVAALVPHCGAMRLIDEVLAFDERGITCRSTSHRSAGNPLRCDGRLPASASVEYGAQAIAAHGALTAAPTPRVRGGVLAGIRAVKLSARYLDEEPGPLTIRAERLVADGDRVLYSFRVEGGGRELASGRIAIALAAETQ